MSCAAMKKILILSIACLSLCSGFKKEKEKGRQLAMVLLKDCKNREGGNNEDMETLAKEEVPTTTAGQCMLSCLYEKLDIVGFAKLFNLIMSVIFFSSTRTGTSIAKTS